ncbi:MAG: DNA polymerase III subunit gamma/tau [Oscillospiraceae bacterium]
MVVYQALYRKWRPLTFGDVVAQAHITTTLQNQLINAKTAHAYLFTGSRGTGKTTCARIFAKAINCENPVNGSPCLECSICKDAENAALSDIIEIDAASNNGVDDIRELRDGAIYSPERCKFKVYIIDEVHMLSTNAFNALLKIMEEPPPYVKFILATTEVQKVPATILSRCQRFDFTRILPKDIAARLDYIAEKEGISLEKSASELIAKIADGGMRDALSLLDQCVAFSEKVTLETVSTAAGIAGRDYVFDMLAAVIEKKTANAITIIDQLYAMSKDMQRLCEELISQFRNLMLVKTVPEKTELLACMPDECAKLLELSAEISLEEILDCLKALQDCNERLSRSITKRVELEMCLIKLCTINSSQTVDNSEIYDKIEKLEDKIKTVQENAEKMPVYRAEPAVPKYVEPQIDQAEFSKMRLEDFTPCEKWGEILAKFERIRPDVSSTLINSTAIVQGKVMLIDTANPFFLQLFRNKENALALGEIVKDVLGQAFVIRAKCSGAAKAEGKKAFDLIEKAAAADVPIEKE